MAARPRAPREPRTAAPAVGTGEGSLPVSVALGAGVSTGGGKMTVAVLEVVGSSCTVVLGAAVVGAAVGSSVGSSVGSAEGSSVGAALVVGAEEGSPWLAQRASTAGRTSSVYRISILVQSSSSMEV